MDWDKLRIFHLVAKAGSFTSAGDALNLSQSSVSRQILALENELGVALFHRHARGLMLTEQGEILQKTAEDVFKKLTRVEGQLMDTRQLAEGPLVVTVSDFIGSIWLAPRIQAFRQQHPEIQLSILIEDRVLDIAMREADCALRLHRPKQPNLIQRHLTSIGFHICASVEYLAEHGEPKSLEDLKNHCLLSFPKHVITPFSRPSWILDEAGIDLERKYDVVLMNSIRGIQHMVETSAGIGVLPDFMVQNDENIKIILPEYQPPNSELHFVYAEERRNSNRINVFRDFLLEDITKTLF